MNEIRKISQMEAELSKALGDLRDRLATQDTAAARSDDDALKARIIELESQNSDLSDELERLRVKRDKDVAALDELLGQLKPLIEEV